MTPSVVLISMFLFVIGLAIVSKQFFVNREQKQ